MEKTLAILVIISFLGPVLGSALGVIKKPNHRVMYNMMAFAGGVMLAISLLALLPQGIKFAGSILASIGLITGALLMLLVEKFIPHIHPELCQTNKGTILKKSSIFILVGMFVHNFPEGMAIALGGVAGYKVSLAVALAIALHNIPEGICTSGPYYFCTKKRLHSFMLASLTAIPILVGFFLAYAFLPYITGSMIGFFSSVTAGFMIFITAHELIPTSCFKMTNYQTIFSLLAGIILVVILTSV